nr:NAD(P)H-dependent oxidoreductase subunit E [Oscillochloris trichoides]
MPLQLTLCRLCARSRPDFLRMVNQLAAEYPGKIEVIELDCMAACDDAPSVMVATKYYAHVAPQQLAAMVHEQMEEE